MLQINVVLSESFDEENQEFVEETWLLRLEHSLVSLSKWESKFEKPFLVDGEKTEDEILAYVRMMDVSDETPLQVFDSLSDKDYLAINHYINAKMSATWFNDIKKDTLSRQTITSELIYYWLTTYQIPWEAETWHLNRLFTLIKVFNAERSTTEKTNKTSAEGLAAQRRALNEKRRKEMGTVG